METRWYFILGDLAANILVACAAVALSSWLIGGSLGMLPGMIIGMLFGMVIGLVIGMGCLTVFLGVMEVATPCMLSGMFGGMWGGMWSLAGAEVLQWGAATGVITLTAVYVLNAFVSGPQKIDSSP